jgi:predicted component of type VI protein secretion system
MTDVARLRDSTQILLPKAALEGLREEIESCFVVTVRAEQRQVRIIGSPVEIKDVSNFLTRNGVTVA